jgi:hypothetical protein
MSRDKFLSVFLGGAVSGAIINAGASVINSRKANEIQLEIQRAKIELESKAMDFEKYKVDKNQELELARIELEKVKLNMRNSYETPNYDPTPPGVAEYIPGSIINQVSNELKFDAQPIVEPTSYDLDYVLENSFAQYFPQLPDVPADVLHPLCVAIFLFSLVGFVCALCIAANNIGMHFGDKFKNDLKDKVPSWALSWITPVLNFRSKYVFYSNSAYIVTVMFTQSAMMLLSAYHFFMS